MLHHLTQKAFILPQSILNVRFLQTRWSGPSNVFCCCSWLYSCTILRSPYVWFMSPGGDRGTACLQWGQVDLSDCCNHWSTQLEWKIWLQLSFLTSTFSCMSSRQMLHVGSVSAVIWNVFVDTLVSLCRERSLLLRVLRLACPAPKNILCLFHAACLSLGTWSVLCAACPTLGESKYDRGLLLPQHICCGAVVEDLLSAIFHWSWSYWNNPKILRLSLIVQGMCLAGVQI